MPFIKLPHQSFRWLLAEMTVVVLGILLAFQIEEWRNERNDRELERSLLESIAADIQADLVLLREYRDTVTEAAIASVRFREYLESGEPREREAIMGHWISSRNPYIWRKASSTYYGWRESGRPGLVSSEELRAQMYHFHEVLLSQLEERSRSYLTIREEFVEASYLDFQFPIIVDEASDVIRRSPRPVFPLSEIPRNENFMTYLNRMGGQSMEVRRALEVEPNIIQAGEELVQQIENHLSSL